ncbi:swr complex subunit [Gnomoniopsis smithogilvyi]|uniref:SWR1-complex protein 5 n=1 Tax=Gnomoniopsis smithogilvyi TaxID=1191159 RepID=A0A9W8YT86_9PEZI|nr:swr complex subunit [Gnomoniopsis smithogilvyi]
MPPDSIVDDEDYASSEDSDFAPEEAADQDAGAESSSDEDDSEAVVAKKPAAPSKKRKQAGDGDEAADAGFENSGDEAIIEKGKKRQKKSKKAQQDQDDEGGEGGLIKTRSMRAVEKAERKAQPVAGPVTIDVDALWASMTAAPVIPTSQEPHPPGSQQDQSSKGDSTTGGGAQQNGQGSKDTEMIKIKRTYNFAGKVHTEEKLVPRDSAEARLYLASQGENGGGGGGGDGTNADGPERRIPRKAFRSVFEPVVVTGDGQRADLNLGIAMRLQAREEKAKKLNTVEKSRMDWAGFVDKEGIKDELVLAGKAKGSFANQQEFLARTEARREEDARRVRLAGKV